MASSYLLFDLKTQGLREMTGRFASFDGEMAKTVYSGFEKLAHQYVTYLKQEAPRDTGRLRNSIHYTLTQNRTVTNAKISSDASYTVYVLKGTRPHAPPISALQGWADRHGINVWRVWWSIKRRGTSVWSLEQYGEMANRFVKRAEIKMGPQYEMEIRRMTGHIRNWLVGW